MVNVNTKSIPATGNSIAGLQNLDSILRIKVAAINANTRAMIASNRMIRKLRLIAIMVIKIKNIEKDITEMAQIVANTDEQTQADFSPISPYKPGMLGWDNEHPLDSGLRPMSMSELQMQLVKSTENLCCEPSLPTEGAASGEGQEESPFKNQSPLIQLKPIPTDMPIEVPEIYAEEEESTAAKLT